MANRRQAEINVNSKLTRFALPGAVALVIFAIASQFMIYVVDQRELAVVLQFGKPVRQATEPGIYFKIPLIETVRILPSTLQFWGDDTSVSRLANQRR